MGNKILNQQKVQKCLKEKEVEIFILKNDLCLEVKEVINYIHINKCKKCSKRYLQLRMFHEILSIELNNPISSKIMKLVKKLAKQLN